VAGAVHTVDVPAGRDGPRLLIAFIGRDLGVPGWGVGARAAVSQRTGDVSLVISVICLGPADPLK